MSLTRILKALNAVAPNVYKEYVFATDNGRMSDRKALRNALASLQKAIKAAETMADITGNPVRDHEDLITVAHDIRTYLS